MALLGMFDYGGDCTNGVSLTLPSGTTVLRVVLTGAGGAGDYGRNGYGGAGGGRGAVSEHIFSGDLSEKIVIMKTGIGGYAPTSSAFGNIGTSTSIKFDNNCELISGGGQRALGVMAGCGGNTAISGSLPSYITGYSQHNLGSEIGQNAFSTLGGSGAANGDCGGGGNGGNVGCNGTGGVNGYISCQCYSE